MRRRCVAPAWRAAPAAPAGRKIRPGGKSIAGRSAGRRLRQKREKPCCRQSRPGFCVAGRTQPPARGFSRCVAYAARRATRPFATPPWQRRASVAARRPRPGRAPAPPSRPRSGAQKKSFPLEDRRAAPQTPNSPDRGARASGCQALWAGWAPAAGPRHCQGPAAANARRPGRAPGRWTMA